MCGVWCPLQEPFFLCVQRGDLCYLTELLTKDPEGVNAREEVCVPWLSVHVLPDLAQTLFSNHLLAYYWQEDSTNV